MLVSRNDSEMPEFIYVYSYCRGWNVCHCFPLRVPSCHVCCYVDAWPICHGVEFLRDFVIPIFPWKVSFPCCMTSRFVLSFQVSEDLIPKQKPEMTGFTLGWPLERGWSASWLPFPYVRMDGVAVDCHYFGESINFGVEPACINHKTLFRSIIHSDDFIHNKNVIFLQ